jgi:hypothetical protein
MFAEADEQGTVATDETDTVSDPGVKECSTCSRCSEGSTLTCFYEHHSISVLPGDCEGISGKLGSAEIAPQMTKAKIAAERGNFVMSPICVKRPPGTKNGLPGKRDLVPDSGDVKLPYGELVRKRVGGAGTGA